MKNGYVTYRSEKLVSGKRGKKNDNEYGMPNKNFEIQFDFKTKSRNTALFSVEDNSGRSHDRHIYIKNGRLYHRVWPGSTHLASRTNYADGNWHTLKLIVEKGQPIITMVDDKRLRDYRKVDQSNFNWASTIVLGESRDMGKRYFKGSMRNVFYRATDGKNSDSSK